MPSISALNAVLRNDYIDDCQKGLDRWNRFLAHVDTRLTLPNIGFHRAVGAFAGKWISPDGRVLTEQEWEKHREEWLPTEGDRLLVASLMKPGTRPGQMASWLAPPSSGIHAQPVEFEYVRG